MSFSRCFAIALSGAALSLLLAGPAVAATVSSPGKILPADAIPSDCSYRGILPATLLMTCTDRPADQQWQVGADCYDYTTGGYVFTYGSIVTGDGTSAITGCYPRKNVGFFPVS
jgi:hypothetical protein